MPKQKRQMPSRAVIAKWWRGHYEHEWAGLRQAWNWDVPVCWMCGWKAQFECENDTFAKRFNAAPLTRCHLQDHCVGRVDTPDNLILLCHLCHTMMPAFEDRAAALDWVRVTVPSERFAELLATIDPSLVARFEEAVSV